MRILQNIAKQRSFTKLYWRLARKALLKSVQPVLARAEMVYPEDLKHMTRRLLISGEVEGYIDTLWRHTGSTFAVDTIKRIRTQKDEEQDLWDKIYKRYAAERSAKITGILLDTEAENINLIIDRYILEGNAEGLSIQNIAERMRRSLSGDMVEMQTWEAQRIARTEVIGASNQASFEGAQSTGLDIKKAWMHSGILDKNYRVEHVMFQDMGPQEMSFEYAANLKFPGDMGADPGQIINCRCVTGWDVD